MARVLHHAAAASQPRTQIILRSTLPQHFRAEKKFRGGYFQEEADRSKFAYSKCLTGPNDLAHWTNPILRRIAHAYGFQYLNSFPLYADRWDLHYLNKTPTDCTHWCYTPEVIGPEVALLNQLVR